MPNMSERSFCRLFALPFLFFAHSSVFAQVSFTNFGPNATLTRISDDGSIVVGQFDPSPDIFPALWTRAQGLEVLPNPEGHADAKAMAVSSDGSVLLIRAVTPGPQGYLWTRQGGYVPIGIPTGYTSFDVIDISADGTTVVGNANSSIGYVWRSGQGFTALAVPSGFVHCVVDCVSADGSVVGGSVYNGTASTECIWQLPSNPQVLGTGGNSHNGQANALSQDGEIAGGYDSLNGGFAFRWTQASGLVSISNPGYSAGVNGMSNDGSVMVGGGSISGGPTEPFIWTAARGMISLRRFLVTQGIPNLNQYSFGYCRAFSISADGRSIVGRCVNLTTHDNEYYVAHIDLPIPPPTTVTPSSDSLVRGFVTAGGVSSLQSSDDNYLQLRPGVVLSSSERPCDVIFEGTSPNPCREELRFKFESHATTSVLNYTVSLFDFTQGTWIPFDSRMSTTSDDTIEIIVTNFASRYTESGTNRLKARIAWKQVGPIISYPWYVFVDFAQWAVDPY